VVITLLSLVGAAPFGVPVSLATAKSTFSSAFTRTVFVLLTKPS